MEFVRGEDEDYVDVGVGEDFVGICSEFCDVEFFGAVFCILLIVVVSPFFA